MIIIISEYVFKRARKRERERRGESKRNKS
jgi:hypothetical protein